MHYYEALPDPRLAPFVRCYWGLRMVGALPEVQRVLPDGCCELVLHCGDNFTQHEGGDVWTQAGRLFVGPTSRPLLIAPGQRVDVLAIRFQPGGAALLLDQPLSELRDCATGCDDLGVRFGFDLIDALTPLDDRARIAVVERLLLPRLERVIPDRAVLLTGRAIVKSGGAIRIEAIARHSGISLRQLQRRFQAGTGLGLKTLARLARVQRALSLANAPAATLARIAVRAGYSDQAHFTREFSDVAGVSPAQFFRETHQLNDLFFASPADQTI